MLENWYDNFEKFVILLLVNKKTNFPLIDVSDGIFNIFILDYDIPFFTGLKILQSKMNVDQTLRLYRSPL